MTNEPNPNDQIRNQDAAALAEVGVFVEGEDRSGTYILRDFQPVCALAATEGLELLPIAVTLEKYEWLREKYYWKLVSADLDEVTAYVASQPEPQGVFVRVRKGCQVTVPCQSALYMASAGITQAVHNIIILEEDAELELITGCVTGHGVSRGTHWAVTESYICLLYTSPSPRDGLLSRMPSSA